MPGAYLWAYDPVNKKWLKVPCATDGTLKVEITNMKFWQLEDTPNEYTGQAGKGLRVKSSEDGLEFVALALDPHGNEAHDPDMLPLSTSDAINAYMSGNKWLSVATSGIVGLPKQSACILYQSTQQTLAHNTWTKVVLDAEEFDIQNEGDTANYRVTVSQDGKYLVIGSIGFYYDDVVADKTVACAIYINGGAHALNYAQTSVADLGIGVSVTIIRSLSAGDYVELYGYHNFGADARLLARSGRTYLCVIKIA